MRRGAGRAEIIYLLILIAVGALLFSMFSSPKVYTEVPLSTVAQWLKNGEVEELIVSDGEVKVKKAESNRLYLAYKEVGVSITETMTNLGVPQEKLAQVRIVVEKRSRLGEWVTVLGGLLPLVFVVALFYFLMRQAQGANNQAFSFGKSRARLFTTERPTVTFDDVAGVDEAKEELKEVVEFLREPQKFAALGARIPKGVLLVGPPGTGKTLLAKAVAGEAGVPFFSISGSEFVEMFVGVGAARVRDLFDQAKRHSPCIVFIDEIDAVGRYRGAGLGGSHDEREQTLNQILVEMDGFDTDTNVIVMAASVTGDTPILIRDTDGKVKLLPIGEFVDRYYQPGEEGVEKPVNGVLALGLKPRRDPRNAGRLLFGHSTFVPVRGVFRHRVNEIYEIEFQGGRIRATGNHSVFVRTKKGLETKAVAELKPGDELVALPYKVNRSARARREIRAHRFPEEFSLRLPVYRGKREEEVLVTPQLCRLLGYYVAEGYAREEVGFRLNSEETEAIADVQNLMRSIFKVEPDAIRNGTGKAVNLIYNSRPLADFFAAWCGGDACGKHIPSFLFEAPREYFLEFLKGYFLGDGHLNGRGKVEITSVNKQFILELHWLCRMHGINSYVASFTVREGRRVGEGNPLAATRAYRLGIGKSSNPFLPGWEPFKSKAHRAIVKSVRKLPYDGYVYDLCGCENEAFFGGETPILLHNTNRPDILDPALLRPGRFDRRIVLDRPDVKGRRAILEVHVRNKPLDKDVDLDVLARETPGFVGADIENMVNEAAILAARRNKKAIGMKEFQEAIERVIAGPERKSRIISEEERRIIAYHEAGHALVMHHLPNCDPVHKISIIARGMALGYTMPLPEEDRYLQRKSKFLDELAGLLGGRAAEEIVFGDVTTGAANDLEQATKLARAMVTRYGMSDKLGPMTFGEKQELVFLGKEIGEQREYSEKVAQEIDEEVRRIIQQAYERAKEILRTHRDKLDRLAQALMEKETLEGEELKAYLEG